MFDIFTKTLQTQWITLVILLTVAFIYTMTFHIKIKTDRDNCTHASSSINSRTLCLLETDGDESMGIHSGKIVKSKIDCPDCISIILFCKNIDNSEIIKNDTNRKDS